MKFRPLTFRAFQAVVQVAPSGVALFKLKGEHNIYEAITRQRRKVMAGEQLAVNRLLGAWKVAQVGIEAKLKAVTDKIAQAQTNGEPVSPAWLYQQARWTEFLQTIQDEIDKFAKTAASVTQAQQSANVTQGSKDAKELVVSSGVKGGFKMLPKAAFEDLVGSLTDKSPLYDLFAQLGADAVQKARTIFAQEVAAGQHPYKIAKRFRDELAMTKQRSVLIARTESIRAYTTAQQRNYEANSNVVIASRIVSSRDGRTCPLCLARDGMILQHGQPFARHPACRCALAPVVKYLDVDRGTGEAWLKEQPEDFQKQVLGPSRFKLWKAGQITLNDLVQDVEHPRWGKGIRAKNLNTIGKEIAMGATGSQIVTSVPGMGLVASAPASSFPPKPAPKVVAKTPEIEPSTPSGTTKTPQAVQAPQMPAQAQESTIPAPTGKKANHYADELVQLIASGKLSATVPELVDAVNSHFLKSSWNESHIIGKLKKVGVDPDSLTPATQATVAPAPIVTTAPTGQTKVQTPEDLAAKFPGPNSKATPTDYTKMLVKKVGDQMTAEELAALVQHHFPKSQQSATSVLHHYAAAGIEPVGGFPSGFQYTPKAKPAPKVPAIPKAAKPAPDAASVILHQQVGQQAGSNPGGLYLGADGKQRYVKFYAEPAQAYGEHLANEIYRLLNLEAPTSTLFEHNGKLTYASDILPIEGTVAQKGLTKEVADQILKGFAADVLTGNWDAVGTGLDNVVILQGGGIARIDQGGTFLFRAKNGMKPDSVLNDISEWDVFSSSKNPHYQSVFLKAGIHSGEQLGKEVIGQIRAIEKLRKKLGGWEAFVKSRTPGMDPTLQAKVVQMLETRTDLLIAKAKAVANPPKAPKLKKLKSSTLKDTNPIGKPEVQDYDYQGMTKLAQAGNMEGEYVAITGNTPGLRAGIRRVVAAWTGSSEAPDSLAFASSIEQLYNQTVKPGHRGSPSLVQLAHDVIATRKERWGRLAQKIGLKEAPSSFTCYRGNRGSIVMEYALAAWMDPKEKFVAAPTRRLASWSLWEKDVDHKGRKGASKFYGGSEGVMWKAQIPMEQTYFDKWVDDHTFYSSYGDEVEIVAGGPDPNSIRCRKEDLKVKIGGKEYGWKDRQKAIDAFRQLYGRDPHPIDRWRVTDKEELEKFSRTIFDADPTGPDGLLVLDPRVQEWFRIYEALKAYDEDQGVIYPNRQIPQFGSYTEER